MSQENIIQPLGRYLYSAVGVCLMDMCANPYAAGG